MARVSYETNKQQEKTPMPELDPVERAACFDEVACGYTAEDAINEALYDALGDTAIEFGADGPCIIEDYEDE